MSPRWKFATGSHIQISNNTFVGWSMQTVAYMETFRYVKIVIPQSVRSLCLKQYFPPHKLQNNHAPERRQNNVWVVIKVQVSSTRPTCPHLTLTSAYPDASPHNHATPVDGSETLQLNSPFILRACCDYKEAQPKIKDRWRVMRTWWRCGLNIKKWLSSFHAKARLLMNQHLITKPQTQKDYQKWYQR